MLFQIDPNLKIFTGSRRSTAVKAIPKDLEEVKFKTSIK